MSNSRFRYLDPWSSIIVVSTLVLFGGALLYKGFTHDMLLEAAVFLVSLKLILMAYKNAVIGESLHKRLDRIQESLRRLEDASPRNEQG
jgi:hypothetical protein